MNSTAFRLLAVVLGLSLRSSAVAGITWLEASKSIVVESDTASASYAFRNDDPCEVHIESVKGSCSCLTASASQKKLAPGETAEILAVFSGKNHLGTEERSIAVTVISGAERQVQRLNLHVDIRPEVTLDPLVLSWAKEEVPSPKVVRVKLSHPEKGEVSVIRLAGGQPGFHISEVRTEGGPEFAVTPGSTASPQRALISVTAQKADKSIRQLIIYAIVRP